MSKELDDLSAKVDAMIAASEAETALLISMKAALDAAGTDPAQLSALSVKLQAEIDKVNAAVTGASQGPTA